MARMHACKQRQTFLHQELPLATRDQQSETMDPLSQSKPSRLRNLKSHVAANEAGEDWANRLIMLPYSHGSNPTPSPLLIRAALEKYLAASKKSTSMHPIQCVRSFSLSTPIVSRTQPIILRMVSVCQCQGYLLLAASRLDSLRGTGKLPFDDIIRVMMGYRFICRSSALYFFRCFH